MQKYSQEIDCQNISLSKLCENVREFVEARDWQKYHTPRNLATSVSIEAAELLELFQWSLSEGAEQNELDSEFRERLSDEMADVCIYLCSLANASQINLSEAVLKKIEKNGRK